MASQDVSIRLRMVADGVDQQVRNSETIADNYARAARSAQQVSAQQAGAQQARRAAMAGAMTTSENIEYGRARGNLGSTGASARDFANQAQGLGGLVRLYATVAANVFAVTAAFNALSQAMDTANMVKGLDTLGAASGRSLGTLSKQLVSVTDGAISMREAMSATAMSSSAGMTNQQIIRMGQVAKNASLALGVSMPDAMNRLSRGITKLEPELLDELGIFTKIEPAVQAYALQMGKSAAQLSDFERRQAFANAALKEGEEKFSALSDAAANPFDKFLAQLKNVVTSVLDLINRALGPLFNLLSENPTALLGGLTLLVSSLVRRALPAIGQFREQLAASRDLAQEKVAQKQLDTVKAGEALGKLAYNKVRADMEANADSELKIFEQKEEKLKTLKKNGANFSKELNEALKKDIHEITKIELDSLKVISDRRIKDAKADLDLAKAIGTPKEISDYRQKYKEVIVEGQTVRALQNTVTAEENLIKVQKQKEEQEIKRLQLTKQYQSLIKAEEQLVIQAKRSEIVANMAYNTSLIGIVDAYRLMKAEAEAAGKIGDLTSLKLRAIAAGIGTIITTALGAIGIIIQAVTAAIAVFGLFDAILSSNAKESKGFKEAVDQSDSSVKNATRTLELYETKNKDSIQSTVAYANAFGELSDSLENVVKKFEKAQAKAGNYDKFIEGILRAADVLTFDIFNFSSQNKFADAVAKDLEATIDVAEKFGQSGELQARLQEILGIQDIFNTDKVKEAVKRLDDIGRKELVGVTENFKKRFQEIAGSLDSFRSNLDKTYKGFQEFIKSLALNDPFEKLAQNFMSLAIDMSRLSFANVEQQLKAIEELLNNPEKMIGFGQEISQGFLDIKESFKLDKEIADSYTNVISQMTRDLAKLEESYAKLEETPLLNPEKISYYTAAGAAAGAGIGAIAGGVGAAPGALMGAGVGLGAGVLDSLINKFFSVQGKQQVSNSIAETKNNIAIYKEAKETFKANSEAFTKATQLFVAAAQESLKLAREYTDRAVENSAIRAANTIASAYATNLSGPQAVAEQTRIAKSEQDIKVREAQQALKILNSQNTLEDAIRANTEQLAINTERLKGTTEGTAQADKMERARSLRQEAARLFKENNGDVAKVQQAMGVSSATVADQEKMRAITSAQADTEERKNKLKMAEAKVREEAAKSEAIIIKGRIDLEAARIVQEKQIQDIKNSTKQLSLQELDITKQILGVTSEQAIFDKFSEQASIKEKSNKLEIADIDRRINQENTTLTKKLSAEQRKIHEQELKFLETQLKPAIVARQEAEREVEERRKRLELLTRELDVLRKQYELQKSNQDTIYAKNAANLEIDRARFTSRAEIADLDKDYVAQITYQMDLEKSRLDTEKSRQDITSKYNQQLEEFRKREAAAGKVSADLEAAVTNEKRRLIALERNELDRLDTETKKREELLRLSKDQTVELEKQRRAREASDREAEIRQAELDNLLAKTNFSEIYQQQLKNRLALSEIDRKDSLERDKRLAGYKKELLEIAAIEEGGDTLSPETLRRRETTQNALTTATQQLDAKLEKDREVQRLANDTASQQARFNDEMQRSVLLADRLKDSFGQVGDRIGQLAVAFTEYSQTQEKNQATLANIAKQRLQTEAQIREAESRDDYGEGYEAAKNRLKDLSAEEVKAGQRTLATEEKLVASAKKSFKEKTAAYKVLNTLEKAYHVTRMVNMAIDMATTIKKAALEVSAKIGSETAQTAAGLNGVLMRMPFMIGEIYGKTIGQLGVFGPPVAAALVALAFGKLGGSGSGSVSTTGLTAEDMNSVAGTGQQYINGQLVNREGGVLGDPTEIADSITSMTEIFSKNLFDIFNSDNSRIVKKLESVRENTDATVKALLGQITGYAGGLTSPFGTIEGTKKEDDPWWRFGPLKSTTTTTSVLSSGIQVQGKLGDLINETGDIILRSWENVLVQTKSKFLGVTYDKDSDIIPKYEELDLAFRRSLINALQGFKGSIEEVAISFEGSSERASAIIKDFAFKIETNFKGLNATEALNKFRADLSLNLNLVVKQLYPWITEFQKTGEELGETLARLASDSSNLQYGLNLLGIQFKQTDLYLRTLEEQDFIKQFGGLEQFGDSINYYVDNFQDLTTKFNDQFGKLNKVFAESGLQVPTTKDKYAELVNSLKVQAETNVDARNKLATLILYSETYNAILEDRIQLEKTLEDLDQALYDLENNTSELTKALREIVKSGFEYYDVLKKNGQATQENITKVMKLNKLQALQKIDQDIKTLYETRRNEINKTIESLKAAKDRIVELKNALLQGTESTLTPLEKFSKLSSEYASTLEKARQGDQAAINKFPQVTQSLLSLGRELYSSSSIYTNLFDGVMGDLESLDLSLGDQLTEAEQQLAQLESQTSFLEKIDTSTETTVKKLEELIALRNAVSAIDPAARATQLFEGEKLGINRNDPQYFNKAQQSLDAKAEINRLKLKADSDITAKEAELLTTKSKLQDIEGIAANIAKFKETLKPENQDLLDWVTSAEKILLADKQEATKFYNAAQVSLNDAKTARDLIVKAQTDAANAISLQEVLTAKAAAVSAATDVDKFLASVTTAQAAALEKINSFITFYEKVLAEYPQKLLESQQKALEAQLKAIVDAIQKYLDYAFLQKPVSDKDPQLQKRVSDNLTILGNNITQTSAYLQSLIDTNAPQELIDWVTGVRDSMSADKLKADDFYSRALAEIALLEKGKTDLAATLVAAKSATTIEQANALKLQAETQKAVVEAAASNARQLLTMADGYSQKGIKTFNDALAELPNKLKPKPKLDTEITTSSNTSGAAIVGGFSGVGLGGDGKTKGDLDTVIIGIVKDLTEIVTTDIVSSILSDIDGDDYNPGTRTGTWILRQDGQELEKGTGTTIAAQTTADPVEFDTDPTWADILGSDGLDDGIGGDWSETLVNASTSTSVSLSQTSDAATNAAASADSLADSFDSLITVLTDAGGSVVQISEGMANGTRVIDNGDIALSNASILQSATDLVSTIVDSSNPALLAAYAMGDITEARNNALISLAPGVVDAALNAADTVVSVVTAVVGAVSDVVGNVTDTVGQMSSTFIDTTTSRTIDSNDISPYQRQIWEREIGQFGVGTWVGLAPSYTLDPNYVGGGNAFTGPGSLFMGGEIGGGGNFGGGSGFSNGAGSALQFYNAVATGGPVMGGNPYVVGENGPELFVPRSNGTIISNTQLRQFQESSNNELLQKIDQLIQAVANGAVINVQATRENTQEIAQVISNNTNVIRAQNRVGIK